MQLERRRKMSTINVDRMREEVRRPAAGVFCPDFYRCKGYETGKRTGPSGRRADGIEALFTLPEPFIYKNDLIAGSMRPGFVELTPEAQRTVASWMGRYPERGFGRNGDHFAPDYAAALTLGIPGLLDKISASGLTHREEADRLEFLDSMEAALRALAAKLAAYRDKALELTGSEGYDAERLKFIAENCDALTRRAPETFAEGLQLVWMIHSCFLMEGRYAMALGRIDQYLYPLFRKDVDAGKLDEAEAEVLLANTFVKICERRLLGADDVVNICIGGVDPEGRCAVNDLTYCVIHAVRDVNLPGPNLSARVTEDAPDRFLDECLKAIGTGLGYPALMNDSVNMKALSRMGYELKDVRNYCMVGCIENFLPGQQPPWVDGRFDPINSLLAILFGPAEVRDGIKDMDGFMALYRKKLQAAVKEYVQRANAISFVPDAENHTSPFLSLFCDSCIERGLDINNGGSKYRSAHGAALMGIGTVSDSLAAIEKLVFTDKKYTLSQLAEALRANFEGFDEMRADALAAPKYGNNDDFADKYAVFYTSYLADLFDLERTHDGGRMYIAMASNTSNIPAGRQLGATPDGRLAGRPLSDAASPSYGRDRRGVTSTLLSTSKPDYTRSACGTVLNQKFSPAVFKDGSREKLAQLIRVYFKRGGQEVQINATSREVLKDAMDHPENYQSLVVRVSGFSALYVTLDRAVQEDILARTQHESV